MTPTTPDGTTPRRLATMNRSVTLPARMARSSTMPPTAEIGAADSIETLYTTPNANVIKFSTAASRPSSATGSPGGVQRSGTLSWASSTERTIAAGPLEIYRVPGSVSFLHSGSLLHAIMQKSQCWCVDGVSKFALRVLPDTYYRIELPGVTPEDLEHVEALKETLKKVLYYEVTPCPFARTFSVELPEPTTEVRKSRRRHTGPAKKWKLARAYSWKPEDGPELERRGSQDESTSEGNISSDEEHGKSGVNKGQDIDLADGAEQIDEVRELGMRTPVRPARFLAKRSVTAPTQLSLQSTPPSKIKISEVFDGTVKATGRADNGAPSPLHPDRLRTFQAIPTDMPPSPPDSSAGLDFLTDPTSARIEASVTPSDTQPEDPEVNEEAVAEDLVPHKDQPILESHADEESSSTITPEPQSKPPNAFVQTSAGQQDVQSDLFTIASSVQRPETLTQDTIYQHTNRPLFERQRSNPEDPFAAIQARILARRNISGTTLAVPPHRTFSSTSSSSTGSSSRSGVSRRSNSSQRAQQQQQQAAFATALARKACSMFLGPPAHLVAIMLRIAARFANGAFATTFATTFGGRESSWNIPGSFHVDSVTDTETSTDEEETDDAVEEWDHGIEEDDFGVPLTSPIRLRGTHGGMVRERSGWDVD